MLYVTSLVLGLLSVIMSLGGLAVSSSGIPVSVGFVVEVLVVTVLQSLFFAFCAGVNIGAVFQGGEVG